MSREVAAFLAEFLTRAGYDVVMAHSGAEGLAILREGHVGLVLLDLRLADMDGSQVMEEVQQLAAPPDIVCVTGEASLDAAIKAVEGGTAGYILKPVESGAPRSDRAPDLGAPPAASRERPPAGRDGGPAQGDRGGAGHRAHRQHHPRRAGGAAPDLPGADPPGRRRYRRRLPAGRGGPAAGPVRGLSRAEGHAGHVPRLPAPAPASRASRRRSGRRAARSSATTCRPIRASATSSSSCSATSPASCSP